MFLMAKFAVFADKFINIRNSIKAIIEMTIIEVSSNVCLVRRLRVVVTGYPGWSPPCQDRLVTPW